MPAAEVYSGDPVVAAEHFDLNSLRETLGDIGVAVMVAVVDAGMEPFAVVIAWHQGAKTADAVVDLGITKKSKINGMKIDMKIMNGTRISYFVQCG